MEDDLDRIYKREKWDQAARTTMVTGLDKKANLNEKMTNSELKNELKKEQQKVTYRELLHSELEERRD